MVRLLAKVDVQRNGLRGFLAYLALDICSVLVGAPLQLNEISF